MHQHRKTGRSQSLRKNTSSYLTIPQPSTSPPPPKNSDLHELHNWALRVRRSSGSKCSNVAKSLQRSPDLPAVFLIKAKARGKGGDGKGE